VGQNSLAHRVHPEFFKHHRGGFSPPIPLQERTPDRTFGPLTWPVIAKALQKGDPLVTEVMRRAQWYLGLLTASVVNLVDPEMVVFGGGVVEALNDEFLVPIRVTARQHYIQKMDADRVSIVAGKLGDYAAILGAVALVRDQAAGGAAARGD